MASKLTDSQLESLASQSVNPTTGLQPETKGKSLLSNEDLERVLNYSAPSSHFGGSSFGQDPTEFDFQLRYDDDNIERRAQDQSFTEHVAHGVGRLIGTAGTKLLTGLGYVGSSVGALASGDINVMLDNGWSAAFSSIEENIKEALPIYQTKKYLQGNVWEQMGTLGFWSEDAVDGAAFMVSSILGAKGLDKLGTATKIYSNLAKNMSKTLRAVKVGKGVGEEAVKLKKMADVMDFATMTAFNTTSEAAFEAKDAKDSVLNSLMDRVDSGEISIEDAEKQASMAARNTFWWNMGALAPSNALELSMIFKKYNFARLGKDFTGTKPLTKMQQSGIFGKNALLSAASEGAYEENIQTAIQDYQQDVATGFKNSDFIRSLSGIADGMIKNFTTDEGQKSIALGAIIGLLPGGIGGVSQAKEERKREINIRAAKGARLEALHKNIMDNYERQVIVNPETGKEEVTAKIKLDSKGKPLTNWTKVGGDFLKTFNAQSDFVASLKASNSGNQLVFDYVNDQRVAGEALTHFATGLSLEDFEDFLDAREGLEKEDLKKSGYKGDFKELEESTSKLKERAKAYYDIYSGIMNNYAGLYNLGKTKEAEERKYALIEEQYREAVTQRFFEEQKEELDKYIIDKSRVNPLFDFEAKLAQAEAAEAIARGEEVTEKPAKVQLAEAVQNNLKKATKRRNEIEKLLDESYKRMRWLLDENAQREQLSKDIEFTKELNTHLEGTANTETPSANEGVDPKAKIVDSKGETKEVRKFSVMDATTLGYTTDEDRSKANNLANSYMPGLASVYKKEYDEDGHTHYIYTNGTPNHDVTREVHVFDRKLENPSSTLDQYTASITFKDNELDRIAYKHRDNNDVVDIDLPAKPDGTPYTLNDVNQVLERLPELTGGLALVDEVGKRTFLGESKTTDFSKLARETRQEFEQGAADVTEYIKQKARELEQQLEEDSKASRRDYLYNYYADPAYGRVSIKEVFQDSRIEHLPAIYGKRFGLLSKDGDQVVFQEMTVQRGTPRILKEKQVVAPVESTIKLEDLDIYIARDILLDMEISEDGSSYSIQGKEYRNTFVNKSDAVETDNQGNPTAVTLRTAEGENVRFTAPHIVDAVAYNIELFETAKDVVMQDLFSTDYSDFIIVRKEKNNDIQDYVVYRKDGRYVIYTERGTLVKPHFKNYKNVSILADEMLSKAASDLASKNKYSYNQRKKEIQDEIVRLTGLFNRPTTTEALKYPDSTEVQTTSGDEIPKSNKEVSKQAEKSITEGATTDAAISEAAMEKKEQQKLKKVEENTVVTKMRQDDFIEMIDEEDAPEDTAYIEIVSPESGIRHSATAVSYIHRKNGVFVNRNEEFSNHVINNDTQGAYVIPEIDYENDWWEKSKERQELRDKLRNGEITEVPSIEDTTKFEHWVDKLPLKLSYNQGEYSSDFGLYMHASGYKYIKLPPRLLALEKKDPKKFLAEAAEYQTSVKLETRKARTKILNTLLKGGELEITIENKSMGTPNNTGKKNNLGNVLRKIDPEYDLRTVTLGIAIGNTENRTTIYKAGGEATVGFGHKGNIFLETNHTANGKVGVFKLNPSALSMEHAQILYEALRQSYTKGQGGPKGKYVGDNVTGNLTRDEVINFLVHQGKKYTEVKDGDPAYLKSKQLWVENASTIVFGEDRIPLHNPTNDELGRFFKWATTTKRYAINKGKLGEVFAKEFTIGTTIKNDPIKDNYESIIINSGMILTDLDVVEGTKSLTKNPAVILNLNNSGIAYELTPEEVASTKVTKEKVVAAPKDPIRAPKGRVKKTGVVEETIPAEVQEPVKEVIETINRQAAAEVVGGPLGTFVRTSTMPTGSTIYMDMMDSGVAKRIPVARIISKGGETYLVATPAQGMAKGIADKIAKHGEVPTSDVSKLKAVNKDLFIFTSMLSFDSPATTAQEVERVETEVERQVTEAPVEEASGRKKKTVAPTQEPDEVFKEEYNPSDTFKDTGHTGLHQIGFEAFRSRTLAPKDYVVADIAKEITWLKDRFKDVPVEVVDGLIRLADNRTLFGRAKRDSFILASVAEAGTAYHEAFHRVSLFYLTDEERQSLYSEARMQEPELVLAKDNEVEEYLAEKFRSFVMQKQENKLKKTGWPSKIWNFFTKIWNTIWDVFVGPNRMSDLNIERLFNDIERGRYKKTTIDPERFEKLKEVYGNFEIKGVKLKVIQTERKFREVVQNMFYTLAESNLLVETNPETGETMLRMSSVEDVKKLKYPPMFKKLEYQRQSYASVAKANAEYLEKLNKGANRDVIASIKIKAFNNPNFPTNKMAEALEGQITQAANLVKLYDEILSNKPAFTEALEDFLTSLNIRVISKNTDIDLQEIPDEETGETRSDFDRYSKLAFESSAKDNAAANIKLLLSVLRTSNERSEETGLFKFADFSTIMSALYRDLEGFTTAEDMMSKLKSKMDGNLPYQLLYRHLTKDETLKTQFYRTMRKYRLDFINALVDLTTGTTIRFGSAAIQTAANQNVKEWNQVFFKTSDLFTRKRGKDVTPDKELFLELKDQFEELYRNAKTEYDREGEISSLNSYKEELLGLLAEMGIVLENKALDLALKDVYEPSVSKAFLDLIQGSKTFHAPIKYIFNEDGSIYKLFHEEKLKDTKNRDITFENVFTDEKSIKYLGEIASSVNPYDMGDSIFGAGNNRYYTIMQHTYISNLIDKFKNNPAELEKRLDSVYNQSSLFIKHLVDKGTDGLKLKTLAAMVREDEYDAGREYQGITELEEYLLRIAANHKGLLTPPTPADRRFYYFYQGLPKLESYMDEQGRIDDNTLEVFLNYAKDEFNRAMLVRKDVDDVIAGRKSHKDLFENYHFKYVGRNKVERDKNGYEPKEDDVIVEGKLLKSGSKYLGKGAFYTNFVGLNDSFGKQITKEDISRILEARLSEEIELADQMGIVQATEEDGVFYVDKNILIDDSIVDSKLEIAPENGEKFAVENVIFDNMVNTMMAAIETNKVFTGDPAAFKNAEDYTKRLPGYTSTGDNTRNDFPEEYYKGNELIRQETYNVTTLSSRVLKSPYYKTLAERFKQYYKDNNIKISDIELERKLKAYTEVDQTDAQTFITPEMYKAISIKLGEWNDLKEYAYTVMQTAEAEGRDLTPEEYYATQEIIFQPLKMTYINIQYVNGHAIPTYDKMSMATLFRPIVKGTEIEKVLDRMEGKGEYKGNKPIHHLKFHTAEKVGIKDRRDLYDGGDELTDLSKLSVYSQEFDSLRLQLVTDPHDVESTLVGSQFKKVGFMNAELNKEYSNGMLGSEIINELHDLLGELSTRGLDMFSKEFKLNSTRQIADKKVFMDKMREEGRKAGLPDYVIESFTLNEQGEFYLEPDAHPGNRKWIQTRIISLIKKATIDLELPGNVFIQMSNIGQRNVQKSNELRMLDEQGFIECKVSVGVFKNVIPNYKQLSHEERVGHLKKNPHLTAMAYRIPTQGQNSTFALKIVDFIDDRVGDVIVLPAEGTAIGGFDFDIDKLYFIRHNYDKNVNKIEYLTEEDSTLEERIDVYARKEALKDDINKLNRSYAILIQELSKKIDNANEAIDYAKNKIEDLQEQIDLYRADALYEDEADQSILREHRDTISARKLIKREAFDLINELKEERATRIEDMVINWKNEFRDSFENRPIIEQNIKAAVENRLLDMYFTIALDEKHFTHRFQPLGYGTGILKNLSKSIREWQGIPIDDAKTSLSTVSPKYMLDVKARYKLGKALGSYALSNVHHALAQTVDLGLFIDLGIGNTKEINGTTVTTLAERLGKDNEFISEWFSALIDAHVDIAADPFIYYLNANDYTVNVLSMLLRAGVGGEKTFKFIAQPILAEIAKRKENADNNIGLEVKDPAGEVRGKYEKIIKRLGGKVQVFNPADISEVFNDQMLERMFKMNATKGNKPVEFYQNQLLILDAFEWMEQPSTALFETVMASRVDTKKFGINISQISVFEAKIRKALADEEKGIGVRGFKRFMTETYIGKYTENSIGLINDVLNGLTLEATPAFRAAFDNILTLAKRKYTATPELIDNISNELYVNLTAMFFRDRLGVTRGDIKQLMYGDESVPSKLFDIKAGNYLKKHQYNPLIRALTPEFKQDKPAALTIYKPDNRWAKDSLVRGWKDLFNDPEAAPFAEDLFYYSYLSSGFRNTLFSFYDLLPREVLVDYEYDAAIKEYNKLLQDETFLDTIIDEFYLNFWNNKEIVPEVKRKKVLSSSYKGVIITVDQPSLRVGYNKTGEVIYKPYIKMVSREKGKEPVVKLYKYAGYVSSTKEGVYYAVDKKSYYSKGQVIRENMMPETTFSSNRVNPDPNWEGYHYLNDENISTLLLMRNEQGKLKKPEYAGFVQVTDRNVSIYGMEEDNKVPSDIRAKSEYINPLIIENAYDNKALTSNSDTVELKTNIEDGWYTLSDGQIVFIEKFDIDTNSYFVDRYGYQRPSDDVIEQRIKECK